MLTTSHLNVNLEDSNLATYLIIPYDAIKTPAYDGSLKILPDGTVYIISNENQQVQEKTNLTTIEPTEIIADQSGQITDVNPLSVIQKTDVFTQKPIAPLPEAVTADIKYTCPKCDSFYKTVKEYKEHLKWHKLQKQFKCTKCPAAYNIENNLKIHNELVHPSGSILKSCPICGVGLTFKRAASLKSHLMVHQVEEVHGCEDCDAEFEKEDDYVQHMMTHSTKRKSEPLSLTCSHCEVQFQTKQQLKLHISDHAKAWKYFKKKKPKTITTKEKMYACNICKKSFIKQSLLGRHERIHSGEKPFQCTLCDQSFSQKGTLQIHILKHTGNKPFACTLCPAKFNQKGNLRVHIKKTHTAPNEGQKMFKCPHCSCIFKRIASLNGHVTKAHLKNKFPEEDIVNNVMKNLKDLEEQNFDSYVTLTESVSDGVEMKHVVQLKMIGGVKWYRCTHCHKMCKKPSDLIRHTRIHTKERPFVCKICKKGFSVKSLLISHMNTHNVIKNFLCKHCDRTFATARLLNAHAKKHDRQKLSSRWYCITCTAEFENFILALQHKMAQDQPHVIQSVVNKVVKQPLYQTVYGNLTFKPPRPKVPNTESESTVLRPFHCTKCDARFTRKINLNRHIKGHDGDRRYKCNICPKAFITPYRLKEHLNYHNNIKNFACKVCNKRFVTSTKLRRHMISHNNVRPYTCPYCLKNFQTLDLTRRHIKLVHKKDALAEVVQKQIVTESNNATSVIISNGKKIHDVDDNMQQKNEVQEVPEEPALLTQMLNTDCTGITDLNSGYQTYYVNFDELQSAGISLNSIVGYSQNSENFQLTATDAALTEFNRTNPVLMYNTYQPLSEINPPAETPQEIFDNNAVYQNSNCLNETRTIFDDDNIICMSCNQMFSSLIIYQKHACALNATSNADKKLEEAQEQTSDILSQKLLEEEDVPADNLQFSNGEKNELECTICSKRFIENDAYQTHLAKHKNGDKELNHACTFCTKKFKKTYDLKRHLRTHTGERPYSCDICNKKFTLKSTLQSHIRTHDSNHKQFGCEVCDSFYSSKNSLKVHMTIHTGVMPYKCSICKAEFRTLGSKKSHETMGHRTTQKKKNQKLLRKKAVDILKTATTDLLPVTVKAEEVPNDVSPEYIPFESLGLVLNENNLSDQASSLDLPSQIVSLDIPSETMLSSMAEDQVVVDHSNLLQQLQMTDMVLTTNETGAVPSLILDDVSFLDLNSAANHLQIISLPETDGGGVTISIKEDPDKDQKKIKEKTRQAVSCDICFKTLASKDGLRKHKKNVHGDKKKLSCAKCEEKFDTKEMLSNHEKGHSEDFSCLFCSMMFGSGKSLEEHINSYHQVCEASKEETSALLNLKLDLPSNSIDDPLFNGLFLLKKM